MLVGCEPVVPHRTEERKRTVGHARTSTRGDGARVRDTRRGEHGGTQLAEERERRAPLSCALARGDRDIETGRVGALGLGASEIDLMLSTFHKRVTEHNLGVVGAYYARITASAEAARAGCSGAVRDGMLALRALGVHTLFLIGERTDVTARAALRAALALGGALVVVGATALVGVAACARRRRRAAATP